MSAEVTPPRTPGGSKRRSVRGRELEHERPQYINSRLRALGYRLMPGDAFSYLLHLRPAEWPIMIAHLMVGTVLALGTDSAAYRSIWPGILATLFIWVILLNGGTLAINSAFDSDEGDIGYLNAPPPPPARLAHFAVALMSVGQLLTLLLSARLAVVYVICFAMSVAYSVPPLRLKSVPGADLLINMLGFGALTMLAGWFATDVPLDYNGLLSAAAFALLFAAFYPLTQIYQVEEDRARGDRTLVIALGVQNSLRGAIVLSVAAHALFATAAIQHRGVDPPVLVLVLSLLIWLLLLGRWVVRDAQGVMTLLDHKHGMYSALVAWAVTDIALLAAFLA